LDAKAFTHIATLDSLINALPTADQIETAPRGAINIDVEEIWIAHTLHARLGSAEEEARTAPAHETEFGRREAAPEAVVPLVAMSVDGRGLKAEIIFLEVSWQVLIE